jgi:hypothetical protein
MAASMPYPFAHPAAILPLVRPMGGFAVPSALAIGCMIPDAWYFVPLLARDDSHAPGALLWFCLPAGLLAYLAFHRLLKQPLLALLPRGIAARLAGAMAQGLPAAPWHAVLASLLAGAATHLAWDALTHDRLVLNGFQVLQHISTAAGSGILLLWLQRWLRSAPAGRLPPGCRLSGPARSVVLCSLVALSAGWALAAGEAPGLPHSAEELRHALRTAGMAAAQGLALSTIGYAMLWKLLR